MKKKIIIIVLVIVLLLGAAAGYYFFFLRGDRGPGERPEVCFSEVIETPDFYSIGEEKVMAFPIGSHVTVTQRLPQEEINEMIQKRNEWEKEVSSAGSGSYISEPNVLENAEVTNFTSEPASSEETTEPVPEETIYYYNGIQDLATSLSNYYELITRSDFGFELIDEKFYRTDAPDWDNYTGQIWLGRPIPQEAESDAHPLFLINLKWKGAKLTVSVIQDDGRIKNRPVPVEEETRQPEQPVSLSQIESIDYIRELSPSLLGLDGDSMDQYDVFALDGYAMVGEFQCRRINIYQLHDQAGTNEIAGLYMLSMDGKHLFKMDDSGEMVEISLS